jgi:hypothetical protein
MAEALFIATPTAGGIARSRYVAALVQAVSDLERRGVAVAFGTIDAADIRSQRDALVDLFLENGASHLLFVDNDMSFPGDLAARFLNVRKPFVAAIYTRRRLQLERVRSLIEAGQSFEGAVARAYDFNVGFDGTTTSGSGSLIRIDRAGLGFALIAREVFDRVAEHHDLPTYHNAELGRAVRAFFDPVPAQDGKRMSEDYSFCRRWRLAGGEIWGEFRTRLGHHGDFEYGAAYVDALPPALDAGT